MRRTTNQMGEYVWKSGRVFEVQHPFRLNFIKGKGAILLRKGDMIEYVGCQNLQPDTGFRNLTRIFNFFGEQYFTNDYIEQDIDPCNF